ncbi:hypothetical protein [Streptomyces purpureus]|uniref:SH3 domain-containing protein n=1 Tax=Streptomyces purpureus TaxID=1951 RepID=A0A918H8V4_9ACTN|nr:hypothetical protein [Streptomyces purpureus]GGT46654.1 hypothetical protein GCM10014713_45860 [Streptomyces purpureus]
MSVRIRTLLAGVTIGTALLTTGIAAPAQATPAATTAATPSSGAAADLTPARAADGWTEALSAGRVVRSCPSSSCDVLWRTSYAGQPLWWYNTRVNSAGNRWYELDSPRWGWIYCGNVTAPC